MNAVSSMPALASAAAAAAVTIHPIDAFLNMFNSNPYFIGLMMLLLNLGGRFLGMEVSKGQEKVFQEPWVRRFILFTVLFMGTRNILVALFMTVIVILLLGYLFNENSIFYICGEGKKGAVEAVPLSGLTVEENDILKRLSEKQLRYTAQTPSNADKTNDALEISSEQAYQQNLSFLQTAVTG